MFLEWSERVSGSFPHHIRRMPGLLGNNMKARALRRKAGYLAAILCCTSTLMSQDWSSAEQTPLREPTTTQDVPPQAPPVQPSAPLWQYGGFIDLGYLLDFNHPANNVFRSRGTAWHVDELDLNMAV